MKSMLGLYTLAAMSAMDDFSDPYRGYDDYKIVESELLENKKRIDTIIAKITSQVTSPEPN